jgi:hypothetical protein
VANSVTENLGERQDVGGVMLHHTPIIPLHGSAFNERARRDEGRSGLRRVRRWPICWPIRLIPLIART